MSTQPAAEQPANDEQPNADTTRDPASKPTDLKGRNAVVTVIVRVVVVLVLATLSVVGYHLFRQWSANSQLEARLQKLRDDNVPLSIDELYADALDEEDNALTWIRRARPHTEHIFEHLSEFYSSKEYEAAAPNVAQLDLLRSIHEVHGESLKFYAKAAACSGYQTDWRIGKDPSESLKGLVAATGETRAIVSYYFAHACLLMSDGRFDEALDLILQSLALSRKLEHEPMVIGYNAGIGGRLISLYGLTKIIERRVLDEEQFNRVDAALAECESADSITAALMTERIYGLKFFESEVASKGSLTTRWGFTLDACDYLDLLTDVIPLMEKPEHEIRSDLAGLKEREVGPFTQAVTRAFLSTRVAHNRTLARVRCVRLLNILQHKYPHGIPEDFDVSELTGDKTAWTDPFSGKPLIVRAIGDTVAIYSVGANHQDDGGDFKEKTDEGFEAIPRVLPTP